MSTLNPIFQGTVEKGALKIDPRFYAYITRYEGKRVSVTVKQYRKQRSLPENNYFHGVVVVVFSEFTGYDEEESKDILKAKFLSYQDEKTGITRVRHTSDLNTAEFEDFMSKCRMWGDSLGIYIPGPNEADY
jgi:hypothetical protein